MKELMYDINAGLISVVLLAIVIAVVEAGYRLGRRTPGAAADDDSKAHINATQSSTLGILALLLAFTFSLSLQRFDTVWCAAGTPNAVFEVATADLIAALSDAEVREVAEPE